MAYSEGDEAPQRRQRQAESVREDLFAVIAMQVGHPWYRAKGVGITYPSGSLSWMTSG